MGGTGYDLYFGSGSASQYQNPFYADLGVSKSTADDIGKCIL